jgi:hypothetical protein
MNLRKIIREEADDMWQNLIQGDANIWLSHQMIVFDETPTKEVVIKLIRDAFKSGLVKKESIDSWEDEGVENEVDLIIRNVSPFLRIDLKGWLYYGSYGDILSKNYPELRVINYSEAKDYLVNESEEINDFTWITDEPINPWSQYSMIVFDEKPTREEINYYIELALNTRKISNKDAWRITDREMDINSILNYIEDRGGVVLKIDQWDDLQYASVSYYNSSHNAIKYSQLVNKNLNESEEEDEWAWAKESIFVDEVNIDDRIRVYNTGNEKAFLNWLGNYKQNYLNGEYGDYIEGTVTYESEDDFALSVKVKKYDATIYFPFKNHIESIESMDDYKGLSLAYEIISKS